MLINPLVANDGAELFASQCSRCHHDINRLSSTAEQVQTILQQQSIKQHQFTLSDEDIKLIVNYFERSRE